MNGKYINVILFLLFAVTSLTYGQRIFRPLNPSDPWARYGKSPYSGTPFFYFNSTSYNYRISPYAPEYDDFINDVDAGFVSWNNAGPVQFSRTTSSGLTLLSEAQYYPSYGPAWSFPAWNGSTYELTPSSAMIVLNTSNTSWSNTEQHLNDYPHVLDVQTMVVHEAGHIHGLAHPETDSYTHNSSAPTMAGGDNEYFDNTLDCRSLEAEDIYGTQFLQLRVPNLYSSIQTAINIAEDIGIGYVYVTSNYSLTDYIMVPQDVTLIVNSGVTLNLNNKCLVSTGGTITNNGTISGINAYIYIGGSIRGYCGKINDAASYALSGETITVPSGNFSLSGNTIIPSGVILTLQSGASVTLNSYSITTTSGTITVQSGATVNPYIPLKQSSTIKGLYTTVQTAVNAAASGSTIELQNTTYSGSLSFSSKTGITLSGAGSTIISNGISVTNSSNIVISGMRLSNGPSINSSNTIGFSNSTITGSTALTNYSSSYLSVTYITAENIEASFGVNSNGGSGTLNYSSIQNGDCAVYLTNSADWDIRTGNEFCGNGYDITATLPAYAYVTDNYSYSSSSPFSGSGVDVDPLEYPLSICGTAKAVAVKSNETESSFNLALKELAKKHLDLLSKINKGRASDKFDLRDYKGEADELITDYKKLLSNDNASETIIAAISKIGE